VKGYWDGFSPLPTRPRLKPPLGQRPRAPRMLAEHEHPGSIRSTRAVAASGWGRMLVRLSPAAVVLVRRVGRSCTPAPSVASAAGAPPGGRRRAARGQKLAWVIMDAVVGPEMEVGRRKWLYGASSDWNSSPE
jgi:hypothetical protein